MAAAHSTWKNYVWLVLACLLGAGLLIWGIDTLQSAPTCDGFEMHSGDQCKIIHHGDSDTVAYDGRHAANTRSGWGLIVMGGGLLLLSTAYGYFVVKGDD
ncbi:hypothetical protein K7711_00090 [Nocardia sp. CA2R105]|uniref:hypothetical protein n=1 Tax=Nocardia coffeae TaxID=2873381 RepID=UPI001CA7443F|nr:hypothetical protein [Nocardia coffeae]MBY8854869.1 hypothetical protein [Nocardia coffeae]